MADQILLGKQGEELAIKWLRDKGYVILHQNWRYSHYEIDIIATKEDMLHFIEVKTRSNNKYGEPEERIGKKKIQHMLWAGAQFQYQYAKWKRVQYDSLSITVHQNSNTDYFFIEDIYL